MTTPVLLIHHAANRGKPFRPASLRGLRECLEAKARIMEIDIIPLADGDFADLDRFHCRFLLSVFGLPRINLSSE